MIGGKQHPYPGFNGQIANIAIKLGPGAFVFDYNQWKKHLLNRCPAPIMKNLKLRSKVIKPQTIVPNEGEAEVIEIKESLFATEYSVSGWAKWTPTKIPPWYIVWRLTSLEKGVNKNSALLGDRDLTVFK
jgi:hypothetical protein